MRNFVLFLILLSAQTAAAQTTFKSFTTAGIIAGESLPALELQTVNGVMNKDWFVGVGLAKDDYYHKSLPLFADVRYFFSKKTGAFLYGDLGYHFALKYTPENPMYTKNKLTGGFYSGWGAGMEIPLIQRLKLVVALGHSLKRMQLEEGFENCTNCTPTYYNYRLNRIVLKTGLAF